MIRAADNEELEESEQRTIKSLSDQTLRKQGKFRLFAGKAY